MSEYCAIYYSDQKPIANNNSTMATTRTSSCCMNRTRMSLCTVFYIGTMVLISSVHSVCSFAPSYFLNGESLYMASSSAIFSDSSSSILSGFEAPPFDARTTQAMNTHPSTKIQVLYEPPPGSDHPIVTVFTNGDNAERIIEILSRLIHNNDSTNSEQLLLYHTLHLVDCGVLQPENSEWYAKYKYGLPILHMGNYYWMKGKDLTEQNAKGSLYIAMSSSPIFPPGRDEPDWAETERQLSIPPPTAFSKMQPRKVGSGDFQKQRIKSIRGCELLPNIEEKSS